MRIVSYNLRENAASGELTALATDHDIDILCLQEVDSTTLPERVEHMVLADATRNNRLGLAVYVRDERFEVKATKLLALKKSLHDRVMAPAHERLLAVHLFDRVRDRDVLVGSFHAAPLTASNSLRRKQIAAAHDGMRALAPGLPALMVGDFNYPWFINGLERRLATEGFRLHRSTEPTYLRYRFFSGYFDFVTSTGYRVDRVDVLPAGASDHRAISFEAHLTTD